jgi:hypothetical protein
MREAETEKWLDLRSARVAQRTVSAASGEREISRRLGYRVAQDVNAMTENSVVRVRIDERTGREAAAALKKIGLTVCRARCRKGSAASMWWFRAHPEKLDGLALREFQNFGVARYQGSLLPSGRFDGKGIGVRNRGSFNRLNIHSEAVFDSQPHAVAAHDAKRLRRVVVNVADAASEPGCGFEGESGTQHEGAFRGLVIAHLLHAYTL